MKVLVSVCVIVAFTLAAQEAPGGRVIGEVTAIDAATHQLTVKTDAGTVVSVTPAEKTLYLRVPPGEKDLKKASRIAFTDVAVGDRVLARGALAADGKSLSAGAIIIMTKADLAAKHAADAAEWQRRGAAGIITALNPDAHEFTVTIGPREAGHTLVVATDANTAYRRYAPDSVRFADARPSTLGELKSGDQVRVLGQQPPQDGRIQAVEIVSGSFRNIAATVKAVDAAANEIQIVDLETKKPLTIRVNSDSRLRRLPPAMAAMLAQRRQAGAGVGQQRLRPEGGPTGTRTPADARAAGGPPSWAQGGGAGGRSFDFNQMLERLPALSLAELKPGDAIIVSSTAGADPSRLTAIVLLAGVEPLLTSAPRGGGPGLGGGWTFEIPLP